MSKTYTYIDYTWILYTSSYIGNPAYIYLRGKILKYILYYVLYIYSYEKILYKNKCKILYPYGIYIP